MGVFTQFIELYLVAEFLNLSSFYLNVKEMEFLKLTQSLWRIRNIAVKIVIQLISYVFLKSVQSHQSKLALTVSAITQGPRTQSALILRKLIILGKTKEH